MLCFLSELQQYKVLRSKRNHICYSVLYYVYLGFGFQIIFIQIPFHYEVHSINRLRGDVWLGEGRDAAKVRGRKYIRNRGYGGGFKTAAQSSVKAIFKQLSQSWKGLTNAQILAWNSLANTQKGKSVLGTSSKISGANLYSRLNFWIVKAGGVALATPPALVGVDAPCEADISLTAANFHFQLPDPPAEKDDLRLVIMASAPQSNGVTRAYSKAVSIGVPRVIVDDQIDIMSDYKAVHGEVTAAAPKVFLKYFFINVKTGEKSGEMLGEISL